jgi:hypothetical protein
MSLDYAEPTRLQELKIEVLPPENQKSNASIFNTPTTTGEIVKVSNKNSELGKPHNLPDRQNSLREDGQYRTIDVTPKNSAAPQPKQNDQMSSMSLG